jgi:hypothetical protein
MPLRARKNQYRGVNAHLHSYWQAQGGWPEFHATYIIFLLSAFRAALTPLGYWVSVERSLQVRRDKEIVAGRPEPDGAVYDPLPDRSTLAPSRSAVEVGVLMTVQKLFAPDELELASLRALGIYKEDEQFGTLVGWVELLSPSNKPSGQDNRLYREKRLNVLNSGIVFAEIDYLHESASTFARLPNYRLNRIENDAHPYRVVIIDPRPELDYGQANVIEFDVDMPIPTVEIPLNGAHKIHIDLDNTYRRAFVEVQFGALQGLNYAQPPLNFDKYSVADQARIARRMVTICQAAAQGINLDDTGPLPISTRS